MKKNGMVTSQQTFLKRPGGKLCLLLLLVFIAGLLAFPSGAGALDKCGKKNKGKTILIIYDSKYGSTTDYVVRIAQELCAKGFRVDYDRVLNLVDKDISAYDGYIVAASIYTGKPLTFFKTFLDIQGTTLAGRPVAYCNTCTLGASLGGNSSPAGFWNQAYNNLVKNYPEIFPLTAPNPPCGFSGPCPAPPYWVGLMPGRYIPRDTFPTDYVSMELGGYGGKKDYETLSKADEYADGLITNNFFED